MLASYTMQSSDDRIVSPDLEKSVAKQRDRTTTLSPSMRVVMLRLLDFESANIAYCWTERT
jgi:hypothetical protein